MDNLIEELLRIENDAANALLAIDHERATLNENIMAEITKRQELLNQKAEEEILAYSQASQHEAEMEISQIKAEYKQKTANLQSAFASKKKSWRENIFADVLHGSLG